VSKGGVVIRQDSARWLVRIRGVAPDMPPLAAWLMAGRYAMAEEHSVDTRYLDLYMALEAWRSQDDLQQAYADRLLPMNWWYVGPGAPEVQP
jgi:hypothetical protein